MEAAASGCQASRVLQVDWNKFSENVMVNDLFFKNELRVS